MTVDTGLMSAAFKAGAGFGALECRVFVTTIILIVMLVWAMVMILGWHQGLRESKNKTEYIMMRLMFLGIVLTVVTAVMFFSS